MTIEHLKLGMIRTGSHPKCINIKLINRMALRNLDAGEATPNDMRLLQSACKVGLALAHANIGNEAKPIFVAALDQLSSGTPDVATIGCALDWHDAQLDICTIRELERAINHATHVNQRQRKG